MVDEDHHETVLKVGFLNNPDKHPSLRQKYMDQFDLVIAGDGSLASVNKMLAETFEFKNKQYM